MTKTAQPPRVAVLGGGNGTSQLLLALRPFLADQTIASLHAVVHTADDGGSTGRLREQYGVAAMGDLTKCLMALSSLRGDVRGDEFLRALDFRFTSGDFEGHTLRNMFFAALEQTSDIDSAIATMARILQVPKYSGVLPATLQPITQQVVIKLNGSFNVLGEGEHSIAHKVNLQADPRWQPGNVLVTFKEGDVPLNPRVEKILERATHILVAPGHTYGTILPTLALPALGRTLAGSSGELLVVMTLLTTPHQTSGWKGEDFVRVYESYTGRPVTSVIANTGESAVRLETQQEWVRFAEPEHPYTLLQGDVVNTVVPSVQAGDTVPRAIVIHDAERLRGLLKVALGIDQVSD
jgi:uncharacterized cofD-like protein